MKTKNATRLIATGLVAFTLALSVTDMFVLNAMAEQTSDTVEVELEEMLDSKDKAVETISENGQPTYQADLTSTDYIFGVDTYADATVYQTDYSSMKSAGDDEIAQAVADYKAEQARIAAEKKAAEEKAAAEKKAAEQASSSSGTTSSSSGSTSSGSTSSKSGSTSSGSTSSGSTSSGGTSSAAGSTASSSVASEMANSSRMIGRLYINSIGMTPVAVYAANHTGTGGYWDGQAVTDRKDSAFSFACAGGIVIGDHVNQNFRYLKNVSVGDVAYLNQGNSVMVLKCVGKYNKTLLENSDGHYYNLIGDELGGMKGHILMYTCNGWPNITAVLWEVVSGDFKTTYETCATYDKYIPSHIHIEGDYFELVCHCYDPE